MVYTLRSALALTALASALGASAEDVLFSKRHQKRYIDAEGNWNQSFFHVNDVHAHLDEFRSSGTDCTDPTRGCFGGYARVSTVINERRPVLNSSLFLNAGDEFQGTLFYTYYGGEKIAETINQLGFDGMTLGNHEFDGGDDMLGEFLENLTFPIISANIQSDHPVLNRTIKPFHIYEEFQLAVIGVTTDTTPDIASPGEGTLFSDPIEAVQNTINLIRETTNITRIAALTHIGYENDQALAQNTTGLHLIMGGHSHTPLGTGAGEEGPYPTIVQNLDDEEVFVVTAYRWAEFLGYIDVTYDSEGKILEYHGGPIHLTNATEQNATLQAQIDEWRGPFEEFAAEVVGVSDVALVQSTCQDEECLLGNFMADAMLTYRQNESDTVDFALINAGGIRAEIDAGNITRGEVLTSFPFGNSLVEITMSGDDIWKVFEGVFSGVSEFNGEEVTSFVQVSRGIQIEYNPENSNGSRLIAINIGNSSLDREQTYNIVTLDFLAGGGDNLWDLVFENTVTLETQDQILVQYIQSQSPVNIELERRIAIVNATTPTDGTSGGNGTDVGGSSEESGNGTESSTGVGSSVREANVATTILSASLLTLAVALL